MQTIINIEDPRVFLNVGAPDAITEIEEPEFSGWDVYGAQFERSEWLLSDKFNNGRWHCMNIRNYNEYRKLLNDEAPIPVAVVELNEGFAHVRGRKEIIHYRETDGLYYDVHGEEIPYSAILAWTEI